jgi:hypothetical protein
VTLPLNEEFEIAIPLLETAVERSNEIHLPYLPSSAGARLGETLAPRDSRRALDIAEIALGVARAKGFRAVETELLRVKASALLSLDAEVAEAPANEGYELAQELGLASSRLTACGPLATSWPPRAIRPRPMSSTGLRAPNFEASV